MSQFAQGLLCKGFNSGTHSIGPIDGLHMHHLSNCVEAQKSRLDGKVFFSLLRAGNSAKPKLYEKLYIQLNLELCLKLHGLLRMGSFAWAPSHGLLPIGFFPWTPSHGLLPMGPFAWALLHGLLRIGFFPWAPLHRLLQMGYFARTP